MTVALYHQDSYIKSFHAIVTRLDEENHALVLDQTAFYPGGGGQPCDFGTLNFLGRELDVVRVKKMGDEILHFIKSDHTLPNPGTAISANLDWDRRYKLMRTHTALHILCGTIFRDYGAHVTGGDMDPLEGRMDFEFESMQKEFVQSIAIAVNQEVKADRQIKVAILPRAKAFEIPDLIRTKINLLPDDIQFIRTVEIEGLDLQADGGTHVLRTSEVGPISIVDYKSKGKINKRVYIRLDQA